ncbi:hypothetical protein SMU85_03315 [Streptococcus mutans ST6]|nr:hypothetical protein SMU85_03315 [Streptococcus mutans ST6]
MNKSKELLPLGSIVYLKRRNTEVSDCWSWGAL